MIVIHGYIYFLKKNVITNKVKNAIKGTYIDGDIIKSIILGASKF